MKVNLLETHDRLKSYSRQNSGIDECCQSLINQRPFGDHPFYIFVHSRTLGMDERFKLFMSGNYKNFANVPEKKLIWQPRLLKPQAQVNSMLFKAYPGKDVVKIIWMIPAKELWGQYDEGKVTESDIVQKSIHEFVNDKKRLEVPEDDDPTEEQANKIYQEVSRDANYKKSRGSKILITDLRV